MRFAEIEGSRAGDRTLLLLHHAKATDPAQSRDFSSRSARRDHNPRHNYREFNSDDGDE
jgi:hypothetical protein